MNTEEMIPAVDLCERYDIEISFIHSLQDSGLIEITRVEENVFIPLSQLPGLEKIVRLYEMDINLEGIETITYLLDRMKRQQERITKLVNHLRYYASEEELGELE